MSGNNAKMVRFAFLVYVMNALKLASTEIKCGMPAYPVRESDYNSNRIIGGWEARPHSLPWQLYVLLEYKAGIAACGGTIIQLNLGNSTNLALTSAHCMVDQSTLKKLKPENVSVIAGAHNIADLTERTHEQYDVKSIIIHQDFKESGIHDIALLVLQSPILYSTKTRPICLPVDDEIPKQNCWVAGWGYTSEAGDVCPVLLMISTPKIFYANKTLIAEGFRKYIFLAGSENGGAYRGDSGGPLFCKINDVYVQYGIVAVRAPSYPPGSISIYTRLSTYMNWLKISAWKYDRDYVKKFFMS
ncbi:Plasma kallikrein [Trichinella pseudospiralis]|uniref:Plasma kallikrein n=1 Tax=Trichinella pseudospiralis TaxID=6337 RepID=A0A0V0Y0B3_TRIPS|nr:Plasma kallikrein [Trichinella pseudospiralis]